MAVRKISFVVNVRKNNNMNSSTYGMYYLVAETKKTLELKSLARHLCRSETPVNKGGKFPTREKQISESALTFPVCGNFEMI